MQYVIPMRSGGGTVTLILTLMEIDGQTLQTSRRYRLLQIKRSTGEQATSILVLGSDEADITDSVIFRVRESGLGQNGPPFRPQSNLWW